MRCFLSYSYDTDISVIKQLLIENQINYIIPTENLEYGSVILQTINRQITDSDFIIAVLNESTNVPFEIGLAMGAKKPVFLITLEKKENELPLFLSAVTYTLAAPTDYDKIKYSFDLFLDNLPKKKNKIVSTVLERKPKQKRSFKGKKLTTDDLQLFNDVSNKRGLEFEEAVGKLFKKLDIEIFAENRNKERGFQADFSLWIDEINSIVGNPLIVETKSNADNSSLHDAVLQLTEYLKKYSLLKVGLLIYNNPTNRQISNLFNYAPLVISISFQDLLQQLTDKTLPEIIIQLRHQAVHKEIF